MDLLVAFHIFISGNFLYKVLVTLPPAPLLTNYIYFNACYIIKCCGAFVFNSGGPFFLKFLTFE